MSYVFTCLSKILELLSEGRQFTSSTQGFILSSNIMSNPKTSKQHFYLFPNLFSSLTIGNSQAINVFIITSKQG
jgi:hypothetical protein